MPQFVALLTGFSWTAVREFSSRPNTTFTKDPFKTSKVSIKDKLDLFNIDINIEIIKGQFWGLLKHQHFFYHSGAFLQILLRIGRFELAIVSLEYEKYSINFPGLELMFWVKPSSIQTWTLRIAIIWQGNFSQYAGLSFAPLTEDSISLADRLEEQGKLNVFFFSKGCHCAVR